MIPSGYDALPDFEITEIPSKSYRLRVDGKPGNGMVSGLEAMKQAIFLILHTERFYYAIYSWNYGIELAALVGEETSPYMQARLQYAIEQALLADDRILEVYGFVFSRPAKKSLAVEFTARTTQGNVKSECLWEGGFIW